MKQFVKRYIPKTLLNIRHLLYAWAGAIKYGHPSEELIVIGVTGTSGKSTTVYLLRQLLEAAGFTVGALSTIEFYIAGEQQLNDKKMTMLGKMQIQAYLRRMVDKGCTIAIVETTSEGRVQHRHRFINYDMMVLTNFYPEHIDSHGSLAKYRQAKIDLFTYVAGCKKKMIHGKPLEKIAVVNTEVDHYEEFIAAPFGQVIAYGGTAPLHVEELSSAGDGIHFRVHGRNFHAPMYGAHNAQNIVACMAVARAFDISWSTIEHAVHAFKNVPGRLECIPEATAHGFDVIVDYAFEPEAMKRLYDVVGLLAPRRVIHVFGSTGGGRDVSRRAILGAYIGERADICIVTDEDPYDDDPMDIIADVVTAVEGAGKIRDKTLFIELDRRHAIARAIGLAEAGDLVLVTGKGSEQAMCVAGGRLLPWDDREIVREALLSRNN